MRTFIQLCRVTAMRALREPVTVIFAVLFAPAFIGCMGLIFGNNPVPEEKDSSRQTSPLSPGSSSRSARSSSSPSTS